MRHSANRLKHHLRHGGERKKKGYQPQKKQNTARCECKKYTLNKQLFPTMAVSDLTKKAKKISPQTYKYLFPIDTRMQ